MTDNFTSTVDGAAGYERAHGQEPYDDGPSLSDVAGDYDDHGRPPPRHAYCDVTREVDGIVQHCRWLKGHDVGPAGIPHAPLPPDPWLTHPDVIGAPDWGPPPF